MPLIRIGEFDPSKMDPSWLVGGSPREQKPPVVDRGAVEMEEKDIDPVLVREGEPKVMMAPNQAIDFDSPYIKYPLLGSAKFDGMRVKVMFDNGGSSLRSRTHKLLSNPCHEYFEKVLRRVQQQELVLDCELWSHKLKFSDIMSEVAAPKLANGLKLYMFDMMTKEEWYAGTERPFMDRVEEYQCWFRKNKDLEPWLAPVDQGLIRNREQLETLYEACLEHKLEGVIVRPLMSKYKHGRCTLNEGLMFKWKKWVTVDAKIIGFKQATVMDTDYAMSDRGKDELGRPKRSLSKDHRTEVDAIGSIEVETADGTTFFANGSREWGPAMLESGMVWETREKFIGRWVEIKYQESGTKNKPRMPYIVRWRPDLDA